MAGAKQRRGAGAAATERRERREGVGDGGVMNGRAWPHSTVSGGETRRVGRAVGGGRSNLGCIRVGSPSPPLAMERARADHGASSVIPE